MSKKENYSTLLKDPKWIKKRNEILTRDKNTCQYCGAQDRYMHVHHKLYVNGKKPWEYADKDLITLCNRCHENITEEKNRLYENFIEARDSFRNYGFSDAVFNTILNHLNGFFESIKDNEKHWDFDVIKELVHDAVLSTQNYEDVKTLAKLGVREKDLVSFNYPIFLDDYNKTKTDENVLSLND